LYSVSDIGNIAVWCIILFGFLGLMGLSGVMPMILSLGAIVFVAAMLSK
jgi:hypothetical protein